MKIAISGAAGFIGSHLCDRLLGDGHTLVGLDNFITGNERNIAHLKNNPRFQFIRHDAVQPIEIAGVEAVIHAASLASPVFYHRYPLETLEVGSAGTRNMLELARQNGARFLFTSTSECYGDPEVNPQPETYWGNVNPVGPRSCYDESKRYGEALTMAYRRKFQLRTSIARIFNTYGPRMRLDDGRVVPAFIHQGLEGKPLTIFGDGSQTRSFCYIDDLVDGLCRLLFSNEPDPVNLGNPCEMTILEFAERIRRFLKTSSPLEYHPLPENDPQQRRPDISKAARVLGWAPAVDLDTGLERTVAYFRSFRAGSTAVSP